MRKKWRIGLCLVVGSLATVGLVLMVIYQASQHVPKFYTEALTRDRVIQERASDELGTRVTTLYNDARRPGDWHALFTAEQINGWLAVDLVNKHGELIPDNVSEPRVGINPERVTLAVRVEDNNFKMVFSLAVEAYLEEPNVIALRIRNARAGALPLPLKSILDNVTLVASKIDLPLRWAQSDGDPVALVTIAPRRDEDNNLLMLETLELHDGEIYVSGRTLPEGESIESDSPPPAPPRVAGGADPNVSRQR